MKPDCPCSACRTFRGAPYTHDEGVDVGQAVGHVILLAAPVSFVLALLGNWIGVLK